ncbi:MAG: hypothetical protein KJ630_08550 [Proteobacteria bacterium]|nr:hypothetical protein [Pseudomonadota bacterium]
MKKLRLFAFALTVLVAPVCSFAQQSQMTVTKTETAGTISEVNPDTLVIRSESSPNPVVYTYTKKTHYINEKGEPVSMETVRSGLPVTVYYSSNGTQMTAEKVMVHETTTTTSAKPMIEEKKTTTTTSENPIFGQKKTTTTTTTKTN